MLKMSQINHIRDLSKCGYNVSEIHRKTGAVHTATFRGRQGRVLRPDRAIFVNTDESVRTARSSSACFPVFQCTLSAA